MRFAAALFAFAAGLGACADHSPRGSSDEPVYARWPEPFAGMPRGDEHTAGVCARGGDDPVRDVFCVGDARPLTSLAELQSALGVGSGDLGAIAGLSVAGHSTSLSTRSVSTINPRVIALRLEVLDAGAELLALAFVRGEQFSELVVRDRRDRELRFYAVAFRQSCNDAHDGCRPGDLLTPAIERDWSEVTLYDEQDLANTVMDCAPCHQPNGPGTPKLIRMHELATPWTHWFFTGSDGGRALIDDYVAAKGDEPLAGMTAAQIKSAHPGNLSMLAQFSVAERQPNEFPSAAVEHEVQASAAALGGDQPRDNAVAGQSATWRAAYEIARRGEAIPVPYHDVKATDPAKLAQMSEAYRSYLRGELAASDLPEVRDVFPDDERRLAAMGVMTEPAASGAEVLLQSCSQCHNARLDQSLTRARFRADLVGMTRAQKERAIARLELPEDDPAAMPPPLLKRLSAEARRRAIALLRE